MRVYVFGTCTEAVSLREMLVHPSLECQLVESGTADFEVSIEIGDGAYVRVDAVDSDLERRTLSNIVEILKGPVMVGGNAFSSDRGIRIYVPIERDSKVHDAVVLGVVRALAQMKNKPAPPVPRSSFWDRMKRALVTPLLLAAALNADAAPLIKPLILPLPALFQTAPTRNLELRDEGVTKGFVNRLDFVGAGVTCTASGVFGTCTIAGGGGSGYNLVEDEATPLTARTTINFAGAGVTATDSGGKTLVTIPGGGGSTPTGTGFIHVTAGVQDGASKLVDTADVNADQITYAKIQNVASNNVVLGRVSGAAGDIEELTGAQLAALHTTPQIDIYTTTGANTWNKPTGAKLVEFIGISGGGGGGSGRVHTGVIRAGGGGGAGGAVTHRILRASDCGSSETVTVGAGGTAGAGQTTDSTNGNPGGNGGNTSFGSLLQATGGTGGDAGIGAAGAAAVTGFGTEGLGASGGVASNGSTAGGAGTVSTSTGAGSGGAGGSLAASPIARNGGAGGAGSLIYPGFQLGGSAGTGGAAPGNGTDLTTTTFGQIVGGPGAGGSAAKVAATSEAGGSGGKWGGGGGGSGAAENGFDSGNGGVGAQGVAIVITYF